MKLTTLLLLSASTGFTQTAKQTTSKPPVHHTAAPAHHAATASACGKDTIPTLPAAIPKIAASCSKELYALQYVDTVVGAGASVAPRKWLTVAYTGYLADGTKFDSSIGKDPITFPYGAHQVISGWDTGFEGMNIGGKRRVFIPYQLAYGEAGRPPVIPAKAELIFDLELVSISDNPPPPKTPPAAPPAPATSPSGATPPAATTTPNSTPSTTPGAGSRPNPDGGKPAPPTPATDPTKPTAIPPPPPPTSPKP